MCCIISKRMELICSKVEEPWATLTGNSDQCSLILYNTACAFPNLMPPTVLESTSHTYSCHCDLVLLCLISFQRQPSVHNTYCSCLNSQDMFHLLFFCLESHLWSYLRAYIYSKPTRCKPQALSLYCVHTECSHAHITGILLYGTQPCGEAP